MKQEKENRPQFGALVISLDFELHWGMRDICRPSDAFAERFYGARKVIPRILELFEAYGIAATWATVGNLFAESKDELHRHSPHLKPSYKDSRLNPYNEPVGEGETDDPLHYAPGLIRLIGKHQKQEIATHTFSHYYCLEDGQNRETFAADLDSAIAIAREHGIPIRSIVFPRNQYNSAYDDVLLSRGIICYRGNEHQPAYHSLSRKQYNNPYKRAYRLLDSFVNLSGSNLVSWNDVVEKSGLCNVASSRFLRPYTKSFPLYDRFQIRRITEAMHEAAKNSKIIHLWWHPHNFAEYPEKNLQGLSQLLQQFQIYQERYGMRSLSMIETAEIAKGIQE